MEYWDIDEFGKKIFESCLAYVNNDLLDFCGKKLNVTYKTGIEKGQIYANADKSAEGEYIVTVEMVTYNEIDKFYRTMLYQPNYFKMVTYNEEYSEELAVEVYEYLFQYTIKLIILHELGHIFNGHIDYILKKKREKNIDNSELELRNNMKEARVFLKSEEWQALEWNADDFAATRIVGQTTYNDNIKNHTFIKGKEHAIFLDIIAAITMYTIMGMSYESTNEEKSLFRNKEHLPYRFRAQKYVQTLLDAYAHFHYKISIQNDTLNALLIKIEEWALVYLQNIKNVDMSEWKLDSNLEELDEEHYSYYDRVDNYYCTKMYENLKEYSYFPTLALIVE